MSSAGSGISPKVHGSLARAVVKSNASAAQLAKITDYVARHRTR